MKLDDPPSLTAPLPLFLRVADAATLLGVDPRTVRRGIEAGDIPGVRVGSAIRIPTHAFLDWAQITPKDAATNPSQESAAATTSDVTSEGDQYTHDALPHSTQSRATSARFADDEPRRLNPGPVDSSTQPAGPDTTTCDEVVS